MKRRWRRIAWKVIKYAIIIAVTVALFRWGKQAAFEARGYAAYGGEYLLLAIPPMWYVWERTAREYAQAMKSIRKKEADHED